MFLLSETLGASSLNECFFTRNTLLAAIKGYYCLLLLELGTGGVASCGLLAAATAAA